jgi:hypothetical protein
MNKFDKKFTNSWIPSFSTLVLDLRLKTDRRLTFKSTNEWNSKFPLNIDININIVFYYIL